MASKSTIYVARQSGVVILGGQRHHIKAGVTRVRAGHPILEGREHMFRELDVHFEVEQATARPGERRRVQRAKAAPDEATADEAAEPAGKDS